jgi:hypothetical protein
MVYVNKLLRRIFRSTRENRDLEGGGSGLLQYSIPAFASTECFKQSRNSSLMTANNIASNGTQGASGPFHVEQSAWFEAFINMKFMYGMIAFISVQPAQGPFC